MNKPYEPNHDHDARMKMLDESKSRYAFRQQTHAFYLLVQKVVKWHHDRNLIDGSCDKDQVLKLLQELGELSDSVCKNEDIKDDIGDMLVVMINICERNNLSLRDCLQVAYDDIKHRKGKMVDGIFVKKDD